MRVLRSLVKKEFLQIRRDGLMMRQLFLMPIVQLVILSSAATFEVKRASVYVVDRDRTSTSTGLINRLRASGRFEVVGGSPSMELANEALLVDLENGATSVWIQLGRGLEAADLATVLQGVLVDLAPVILEAPTDQAAAADALLAAFGYGNPHPLTNLGADPIGAASWRSALVPATQSRRM